MNYFKKQLDMIPAALMLAGGPPYNLKFTEDALREVLEFQEASSLAEALRALRCEAQAFLSVAEQNMIPGEITRVWGNTNVACLRNRIEQARKALAAAGYEVWP